MKIESKRVMVVGMALSGVEAAKYLSKHGAMVTLCDKKEDEALGPEMLELKGLDIQVKTGGNPESVEGYELLVLSPGVPTDLPFIKDAREKGIEVIGELELAYHASSGKHIAITGTNGKTTTTALTGEIFKNAGRKTFVVGNIGIPAISVSDLSDENTYHVTEVSSFQLETIRDYRPDTAAILNVTPDHLNRHGSLGNYIEAKKRIFMNMNRGQIVLNYDNETTRRIGEEINCDALEVLYFSAAGPLAEGVFVKDGWIVVGKGGKERNICRTKDIFIPGRHNLENALAAAAISACHGIEPEIIKRSLMSFEGVEHRIEFVQEIRGVKYYNDSKGTNPDASMKAIEAFDCPIVLIAGGMDKGSDFKSFIDSFKGQVKEMILLGETSEQLRRTALKAGFQKTFMVKDMASAVLRARQTAEEGDCVLLSPACASWDMYKSYEHRGRDFKECVRKLRD